MLCKVLSVVVVVSFGLATEAGPAAAQAGGLSSPDALGVRARRDDDRVAGTGGVDRRLDRAGDHTSDLTIEGSPGAVVDAAGATQAIVVGTGPITVAPGGFPVCPPLALRNVTVLG
ncbi:MAG: hypothetical protein ABR540_01590 [Acidimicrobiales bacterium]